MEKKKKLLKILVIEDEVDFYNALKIRLENWGYEVIGAIIDGVDGLRLARFSFPDLIILDIMLPKMDGFMVAMFLKFDKKYKHIPIIILSARCQASDIKLGKDIGVDSYITKPFKSEELLGKIRELLGVL